LSGSGGFELDEFNQDAVVLSRGGQKEVFSASMIMSLKLPLPKAK
jgi:hypothetical protein